MSKIIVFKDQYFGGGSMILTESNNNLIPEHWNDKISSIIVISGEWTLYKDTEYKGAAWKVSSDGGPGNDGVYADWNEWKGQNDTISSIQLTK